MKRFVATLLLLAFAVTACTSHSPVKSDAVQRTTAVAVGSTAKVNIQPVTLDPQQTAALKQGWAPQLQLHVGLPVQIATDTPLPAGGIRLTRTYSKPLPKGQASTLAFYDTTIETWRAVPSKLSADRRAVSATVHHLSIWTDITGAFGAVGDTLTGVADWGYTQVAKLFSTHVDPPTCTGTPTWVQSTVFQATQPNDSILFCTGQDQKRPGLLAIRARVNRGFGFAARLPIKPAWTYDSGFDGGSLDDALAAAGHLDKTLGDAMGSFVPKGTTLVAPGQELSLGLAEQAVRDTDNPTALQLEPPSTVGFLMSILGQLVGTQISMMADGYASAAIIIAGCKADVAAVHDAASLVHAVGTCASGLDEETAKKLSLYYLKRGHKPAEAGKLAGTIVGRATIYLTLIGPAFDSLNYWQEGRTDPISRRVTVFPRTEPVTVATLRTAQVPANCLLPAQRLVGGETTKGSPGQGWINTKKSTLGFADFAGLGYRQALTEYGCTAGGVSWPETLVLIGTKGQLLASVELPTQREHADVTEMSVTGTTAKITWSQYEGAGFFFVHHKSTITYAGKKLVLGNDTASYPVVTVADDISNAAFTKKRSDLADPDVVTDAQWRALKAADLIGTIDENGCTTVGTTASCTFDPALPGNPPPNVLTLTRAPGTIYGWRLTGYSIPSPSS